MSEDERRLRTGASTDGAAWVEEQSGGGPVDTPQPLPSLPPVGGRLRLGQAAFATVYADVVLAALNILVVPYLIRRLGTEPYGIMGIVSVLAGQLGVFHAGVGTAATRLVADSLGRGGEKLQARLIGIGLVSATASLVVGLAFLLLAPWAWRNGFHVSAATFPLALAAVPSGAAVVALTPAASAVYGVLTAREYFLFASGLRVYQGAGRLLAAVAVVAAGHGVAGVFLAQALIDLTAVSIGWLKSRERLAPPVGSAAAATLDASDRKTRLADAMWPVLAVGLPFAAVSLLTGLLSDAEKLAIGMARSLEDFTYYSVPFNAVIKFTVFSGAVVRVLMPRVAVLAARGDRGEALVLTERADRILMFAMIGMLVPVLALAPELLLLWVGEAFVANSTMATRILVLGVAVNTAAFPAHAVVLARGRPRDLTLLYAAEVVLHLGVVYALVSLFGLVGAATAWTARVVLDTYAQRVLAERTLERKLADGAEVWGGLVFLAVIAALTPELSLPWRIVLATAVAGGCAVRLLRGPEGQVLADSVLPWRWRRSRPA